jgi:hypothetical protein
MKKFLLLGTAVFLSGCIVGCTTSQVATANKVVASGQLFCAVATDAGPIVSALINAADSSAITVTGKAASYVANVCAIINGIPVVPPPNPATAPVVAVVPPTS